MTSGLVLQSPVSDLPNFSFKRHVYPRKQFGISIGLDGRKDLENSCFRTWLFRQNKCSVYVM